MNFFGRVGEDGQVVLPAELAREIGFKPGDPVMIDCGEGRITLRTYQDIVREGQDRFRSLLPPDFSGSLVDELIEDRRAQADRE